LALPQFFSQGSNCHPWLGPHSKGQYEQALLTHHDGSMVNGD